MQIEQVHYTFKAHATNGFVVLARLFVVLFSPTILLAFFRPGGWRIFVRKNAATFTASAKAA